MKSMKKIVSLLLMLMLAATAFSNTASAYSCYDPVTVFVELEGQGTYALKCVSTDSGTIEPEMEITLNGKGAFELQFKEPGEYQYLLYSRNPSETQKWDILISVTTDAADNLIAVMTATNPVDGTKPLSISYIKPTPPPRIPQSNKTGDESGLQKYVAILLLSGMICAVLLLIKRKEDRYEE